MGHSVRAVMITDLEGYWTFWDYRSSIYACQISSLIICSDVLYLKVADIGTSLAAFSVLFVCFVLFLIYSFF